MILQNTFSKITQEAVYLLATKPFGQVNESRYVAGRQKILPIDVCLLR